VNEIRLQRSTTRSEFTYGGDAIRQGSWLTMRISILWGNTRCPPTISKNTECNDPVCNIKQDACHELMPANAIPVERIPFLQDSIHSPLPTIVRMMMDFLQTCKRNYYEELYDCRKHCGCCTQYPVVISDVLGGVSNETAIWCSKN